MARSCARRSLAAATIFIALVICCVFLTDRSRRRISMRLAISQIRISKFEFRNCSCGHCVRVFFDEPLLESLDRGGKRLFRRLLELARGDDRGEDLRLLGLQELVETL